MQTRIPDMRIERLRVATYQELMRDVYETASSNSALAPYIAQTLAVLQSQLGELTTAMGESKKSQYTAQISQRDAQRDAALVSLKAVLHTKALTSVNTELEAAKFLEEMAKLPKVKVTPQYDQQTGEITVAVDELLGKYLAQTEAAGIKPQVLLLKRLNDEMCELLILRDQERGEQGPSRIAEIRKQMDVTYRDIVLQINSLDIVYQLGQLRGEPEANPFDTFIAYMIGVIDRFKREILRNPSASGEVVEEEEVEEEETETTTPGGSTGGNGDSGAGGSTELTPDDSNNGGSGSTGSGTGTGTGSSGSGTGSGSGNGIPIQPGPGGDDLDL